jgi:DNA helicase HerA-like ATPase
MFPLPSGLPQSGICCMGRATDGVALGDAVWLLHEALPHHIGIYGATGTGKSWVVMEAARQLLVRGVTTWIFDAEDEYRPLLDEFSRERLWWVRPKDIRLNPLEAPGDPHAWIGELVGLLRSIFFMRDGAASLLSSILQDQYERRGVFRGTNDWPRLHDVWNALRTLQFAQNSRTAQYVETLTRVVTTIADRFGAAFDVTHGIPADVLARQSIIFNVRDLAPQELELFICLLLARTMDEHTDTTRCIVIEEAHVLLNQQRQQREDLGEPPLQHAIRRLRKRAVGVVLLDQVPSLLPASVHANVNTIISLRLLNQRCADLVAARMGLEAQR